MPMGLANAAVGRLHDERHARQMCQMERPLLQAFELARGQKIPHEVVARRPGDIATCYANPELAQRELGWKAEKGIEEMCADTWNWQQQNPWGFGSPEE